MNLYVGQEVIVYCPEWHKVVITEIIEHKQVISIKGCDVTYEFENILFLANDQLTVNNSSRGYFGTVFNNLEDYLPSLTFHKPLDERILTINLGFVYGDKYTLNRLTNDVLKDIIISKEKYMEHYGGILKLLNLYETYEKRIDHIIKTLVLLLHFDLTNKEKICN